MGRTVQASVHSVKKTKIRRKKEGASTSTDQPVQILFCGIFLRLTLGNEQVISENASDMGVSDREKAEDNVDAMAEVISSNAGGEEQPVLPA